MTLTVYKSDRFSLKMRHLLAHFFIRWWWILWDSHLLEVLVLGWQFCLLSYLGTDSFAYLAGRRFGKHKLALDISPNKTIEGSIGGVLVLYY